MKLYSIDEIITDICTHEQISEKPLRESAIAGKEAYYFNKYSDVYPKPLNDNNSFDDLLSRITTFLGGADENKTMYFLSKIDVLPREEDVVTIYAIPVDYEPKNDRKATWLAGFPTAEEALEEIDNFEVPAVLYVDHVKKTVQFLIRPLH